MVAGVKEVVAVVDLAKAHRCGSAPVVSRVCPLVPRGGVPSTGFRAQSGCEASRQVISLVRLASWGRAVRRRNQVDLVLGGQLRRSWTVVFSQSATESSTWLRVDHVCGRQVRRPRLWVPTGRLAKGDQDLNARLDTRVARWDGARHSGRPQGAARARGCSFRSRRRTDTPSVGMFPRSVVSGATAFHRRRPVNRTGYQVACNNWLLTLPVQLSAGRSRNVRSSPCARGPQS